MLRLIFNFTIISSIFKKSDDELDILPPPPPFPEIGLEEKMAKDTEKARKQEERRKQKEIEAKRQEEQEEIKRQKREKRKEELRRKKETESEEKRRLLERLNKEKLRAERSKELKKNVYDLLHKAGLVKTEEEKKEIERQKEERRKQREIEKQRKEEERKKAEEERRKQKEIEAKNREDERRQREIERQRKEEIGLKELAEKQKPAPEKKEQKKLKGKKWPQKQKETVIDEDIGEFKGLPSISPGGELMGQSEKKTIFERIFGKKKEAGFEKELENIGEDAAEEPEMQEFKFPEYSAEERTEKPKEVLEDEGEIQKAINSMARIKTPLVTKGLFKKKEPIKDDWKDSGDFGSIYGAEYTRKIELPEVMPKTYDKVDSIEIIEEKIHKARLALMDFKFDEAKMIYIEVMKKYNALEPKDKSKVYQDIKDLYYERKNAEKFAK